MQRLLKLFVCCMLLAGLALGVQAQDQPQQGKKARTEVQAGKKKKGKNGKKKGQNQPKAKKELSAEQLALMDAAMPKAAVAKPKKARKVLVFTLCKGFVHDSVPVAAKALELMGQKTGAFEATVSDNLDMFLPENLNQFDGVIMDNTTGRYYFHPAQIKDAGTYNALSADQKKEADEYAKKRQDALVAFVKGGKALIGVHAATDMCYDTWPEYGEMIGGYFAGHPWHCVVPVKVDLPDHVINKPFEGKTFQINDEIYVFKTPPYDKAKLLELLSLDTPNLPPPNTGSKVTRPDGDYAVSWVKKYGEGRVFYCSLGHEWAVFWTAPVLDHYLRGIQYALGDLEAPDDPALNKK